MLLPPAPCSCPASPAPPSCLLRPSTEELWNMRLRGCHAGYTGENIFTSVQIFLPRLLRRIRS